MRCKCWQSCAALLWIVFVNVILLLLLGKSASQLFFCIMYAELLVWLFRLNDLLKNFPSTWPKMAEFPLLVWRQEMWATWHVQCTKLQNKKLNLLSPILSTPPTPPIFQKLESDFIILWNITLMQKRGRQKMKWKGPKRDCWFHLSNTLSFIIPFLDRLHF